ncbi:hypothetical protein OG474_09915 [Kribbella sp. NBC_01505]|uniref:hypothetical protein n=1 Tax=Kribbella sp. NBC_01505 TaxID=2903580 RepID=UPI00386EDD8F
MHRTKPVHVLATALALGALLSACGSGDGAAPTDAGKAPQSKTSTAPVPVKATTPAAPKAKDAATLASELGQGKPRVWTAEDDPNKLLGRPGGYTSAASVRDKRVECSEPKNAGVSCGASVEVFASAEDVAARAKYVAAATKAVSSLEYDTVVGTALLRVTGDLTPAQAAEYAAKFKTAAAS